MNYPLISEYIEAIKSAEDNFEELSYLRPVWGDDGLPVMTSGNFAVVFKMKDERSGKFYAVKCFTKEQEGRTESYREIAKELKNVSSSYLVPIQYLEKELFVDTDQTTETEFPVLLMDWVEGKTLDKYLRENLDDKFALEMLTYRFSQLAQWLISQPFAHGDLKYDNILVRADGTLVLVDYDGMYVPAMKGQKARELGSPDFRHPLKTEDDFDEHVDDFSLVSILLSIKAISINPLLLEVYGASDRLLLSEEDYRSIGECELFRQLFPSTDKDLNLLVGLLTTLLSCRKFVIYESTLVKTEVPDIKTETPDSYNHVVYGSIRYSPDHKYVLGVFGLDYEEEYEVGNIRHDSLIICDDAFNISSNANRNWLSFDINGIPSVYIDDIEIPANIIAIGKSSLSNIHDRYSRFIRIKLNEGLVSIGDYAFAGSDIDYIEIPSSVSFLGSGIFAWCRKLKHIVLPDAMDTIPFRMFDECESLKSISLPSRLKIIGSHAFEGCRSLVSLSIPDGVESIGDYAFMGCESLTSICLPPKINVIGSHAFDGCRSLVSLSIPDGVKSIGDCAFHGCSKLSTLSLPESLSSIEEYAFSGCKNLVLSSLPPSCRTIGDYAFGKCVKMPNFKLPNGQWVEHYKGDDLIQQFLNLK